MVLPLNQDTSKNGRKQTADEQLILDGKISFTCYEDKTSKVSPTR